MVTPGSGVENCTVFPCKYKQVSISIPQTLIQIGASIVALPFANSMVNTKHITEWKTAGLKLRHSQLKLSTYQL